MSFYACVDQVEHFIIGEIQEIALLLRSLQIVYKIIQSSTDCKISISMSTIQEQPNWIIS